MTEHVRVVGTGLLGTSIGIALSRKGIRVSLHDISPTAVALARDLGAGVVDDDTAPDLVVVAAPPDVAGQVVADELERWPDAFVTDVASVKATVLDDVTARAPAHVGRYVGSHPMAGRERSGAVAAQADLFEGRTWVICPHDRSAREAHDLVRRMALAAGAVPTVMGAREHDAAVATVSHLPQVAASLVAARLREVPEDAVALAGQGVRDVTRIAASDPLLWTQILAANAEALLPVVDHLVADLDAVRSALQQVAHDRATEGARGVLAQAIAHGQLGRARIPGKHGAPPTTYATLIAVIPDEPGSLARLFADVGDAGVSIEDVRIEHARGGPVGLAELYVVPAAIEPLREALVAAGWNVHD
ncbi:prephenate dehydrogenase [Luteipulveratus halotolerans]|uniref:Prephenate dehydrogenase n=1 Tax=Luteipulveratus halotolerans TaxID=1631356 RepID=A0A0L6CHS0_9MICO|nr:prephenate dehydrogenase [Luteipulveratus halotolerans]KNX37145.1 prephenate dehydrogenase [Luteipulveratus halotolerans]